MFKFCDEYMDALINFSFLIDVCEAVDSIGSHTSLLVNHVLAFWD